MSGFEALTPLFFFCPDLGSWRPGHTFKRQDRLVYQDLQSSAKQAKTAPCVVVPHLVPTICALHLCHDTLQTQRDTLI